MAKPGGSEEQLRCDLLSRELSTDSIIDFLSVIRNKKEKERNGRYLRDLHMSYEYE
jgi:hypothetical protein